MAQIPREQVASLTAAIEGHDFLRRVVDEIERLHRVVFHGNEHADWSLVRQSAEQILVAEIVSRHRGQIDGIYFTLRNIETSGRTWDEAIRSLAANLHSYYTTPLGIVMRHDLFDKDVIFFMPEAHDWKQQARGRTSHEQARVS